MSSDRFYLGDSVYVDIENHMVKLTTENGMGPSNTIYLDVGVMEALNLWWMRMLAKYAPPIDVDTSEP